MHDLAAELFPLPRSLTGDGVRATLARLGREIPIEVREVPSGTPVLDWTVPDEWNVREAWIAAPDGTRVVDFADSNLHLVGYSMPVRTRLSLEELEPHLHTLPDQPELIPYRTAYYSDTWGFCLRHAQLEQLADGEYEVCIDATRAPGFLTYGEVVLPGDIEDEVLISCHVCHPSLANDNLSGLVVATALARELVAAPRRHTFRFLFAPGTIGAITWLSLNRDKADRIAHGLVLTGLGDAGRSTYKRSRRGDAAIDRAAEHVLAHSGDSEIRDFIPWGYDERQYCSPGFDLPVGCLMRTPHGEYPEYHTSADNLDLLRPDSLADSLDKLRRIVGLVERDRTLVNLFPHGEPQLGRRGLYTAIGGAADRGAMQLALLWVLNQSDGTHTLIDIAERAGMPFEAIEHAAVVLLEHGLVAQA